MTNQLAIIFGALIIGASILGAQFVPRYEISSAQDAAGNWFVWRVNSRIGEIQACSLVKIDNAADPFADIARGRKQFAVKCGNDVEAKP